MISEDADKCAWTYSDNMMPDEKISFATMVPYGLDVGDEMRLCWKDELLASSHENKPKSSLQTSPNRVRQLRSRANRLCSLEITTLVPWFQRLQGELLNGLNTALRPPDDTF